MGQGCPEENQTEQVKGKKQIQDKSMGKSVTLSDIAARCGVSIVTVSKALSGQRGVSEATRQQISETAQKMGYLRSRAEKQSADLNYTVGVVAAARYFTNRLSMYWSIYRDLSMRLGEKGCFCLLELVPEEEEEEEKLPGLLDGQHINGMFVLGSMKPSYVRNLEDTALIPLVFVDTLSLLGNNDSVIPNNFLGGQKMVGELLQLGHEHIGFVGTLRATNSIDDRYLGGMKALMEKGLSYEADWLIDDRDPETGGLYEAAEIRVPEGDVPSAFFCSSDRSAQVFVEKLQERGLRVPEDVSLVGFDNYEEGGAGRPFFTTYDINRGEMTKRAVHVLLHRIENEEYRSGISLIQGKCVMRMSTRRLGTPVPDVSPGGRKNKI